MSDAAPPIKAQPGDVVIRARWRRWSARTWRRVLSALMLVFIFLCVIGPVVLMALVGFNNPPSWITNAYEYKIASRLAFSASIFLVAIVGVTWLLGIVAAMAGSSVLGGGSRSLRARLKFSRCRLGVITAAAVCLRIALLAVAMIAALYTYTHILGPRVETGLPDIVTSRLNKYLVSIGILGIITIIWLIGPILRTRYSTALGALAATFAHGSTERAAFALGARFGMGLLGTLAGLWGSSSFLLIILSIVDPTTYRTSYPVPTNPVEIAGVPLVLIVAGVIAIFYALGQVFLASIFRRWATQRMITKQKAASKAAKGAVAKRLSAASQSSGS